MDIPQSNNTNFPLEITGYFRSLLSNYKSEDEFLKEYQYIVSKYVLKSHDRGILAFWGMGFGKTYLAIAIAEEYRKLESSRKIIVLSAKSLAANFEGSVRKFAGAEALAHYKFISSNSSNMLAKLQSIGQTDLDTKLDLVKKQGLENSLIIVDEAHNLFNAITNGSKNAVGFYDLVMKTKDIKLIFLSGTPAINEPFELVPCFNMLRGYLNKQTPLFPENYIDFKELFIREDDNGVLKIKNVDVFQNRIVGLLSYYGPFYFNKEDEFHKEHFPHELPTEIIRVPMSMDQHQSYLVAREKEKAEVDPQRKPRREADRFKSKSALSTSYRIESRQLCNFLYPISAIVDKKRDATKLVAAEFTDDFMRVHSPKFVEIYKLICKMRDENRNLGIFYSSLIQSGIIPFSLYLIAKGWQQWQPGINVDPFGHRDEYKYEGTFAIISGDVDPEIRKEIVEAYNSSGNIRGGVIDLLLVSSTGVEGLDLKGGRYAIMCEPFWNNARANQFRTRIARYDSHIHLEPDERNTQMFIFLSDHITGSSLAEPTTDIVLYEKSIKFQQLIDIFLQAMIEASIDCATHKPLLAPNIREKLSCLQCRPTNHPLFKTNIMHDLGNNTCEKLDEEKERKINAQKIIVDKNTFYFTMADGRISTLKIYEKPVNFDKYIQITETHPLYSKVVKAILADI